MAVDYHIHTNMCGHAAGEMEEYVAAAKKAGLAEMGFSDHIPMYFLPPEERDHSIAMKEEELPLYVEKVQRVRDRCYPYPVKLGIEADYAPGMEKQLSDLLGRYEFDYILGSIHFVDGWGFDNPQHRDQYARWDLYDLYSRYFSHIIQAASSGLFDTLAHPDLIKKFGFRPDGDLMPVYQDVVKAIADSGVCVEVNTAGLRVPAAEIYPAVDFLRLCFQHGVQVTLGSDAHSPEQVGAGFGEALGLLKSVGYSELTVFTGRKKNFYRL